MLVQSLEQSISIFEKCLSYDFNAVLLNDTLEDPSNTHIPTTWRSVVVDN